MKTLFTLLFVAVHAMAISQTCSFTGTTQADLDNFIIDNPTCTVIEGDVTFTSDVFTQLDGFANITQITGTLTLSLDNTMDITGLSNLTSAGNLGIYGIFPNLNGLENLTSVGVISMGGVYSNISALNGIQTASTIYLSECGFTDEIFNGLTSVTQTIEIYDYEEPQLLGFNNLVSADSLYIEGGYSGFPQPLDIDGFHNLEICDGIHINWWDEIHIVGFENLQQCNYMTLHCEDGSQAVFPPIESVIFSTLPSFPLLTEAASISIIGPFADATFSALETLYNLEVITLLPGDSALNYGALNISFPQLQTISNNLTLQGLNITDLNMSNLSVQNGNLSITHCLNLSVCNEEFICNKIALQPELVDIHDNGVGCSTIDEIALNCGDLYIQGNVFVDMDCNGTFNSSDIEISHPIILNDSNNPIGASTSTGEYLFIGQQNTSYTFVPSSIAGTIDGAPITLTTGPDNTPFTNNNFALCPDLLYHDIAVTASSSNLAPGFQGTILFHIENLSYNTETVSVNAVLSLLNVMVINSSTHPYSTSLNTITFDDFTIGAGETITITLSVTLDASTPLGSINSIEANVTNGSTENDLSNNQDTFQNVVIGAYDPNDISVDREAIDFTQVNQDGEWLVYQIRFQNTGTEPAQFINVVNEQDLNLDMSTLDMIAASHNYELIFNGREITWFFDNIQLPDSTTDLLGSQGYILFRIKTNPGIVMEDIIESTAAIYFDYNEPVVTNTATTVFYVCPESISAAGNTTYCEGETVALTANTGYDAYNWTFAGNIIGDQQEFNSDWSAGIYAIEFSGSTLYCISSSVIEITVNATPETPSITQDGNTLTASGSGTFTWMFNNEILSDTDNSIEISASGDYSVSVSTNGCSSETSQNNFTYIGINENKLVQMSVFPNPFTSTISLQLPAQTEKITVTDVSGKLVFEKNNISTSQLQLDLSFLEAGSYFITINSATGKAMEVIVKM